MLLSLLIGVAAQGQQCSATISCPKGLLCNFTDGAKQTGVCFNPTNGPLPTTNTTACQSISDCTLGQICTNNVCQNPGEAVSTWFTTTNIIIVVAVSLAVILCSSCLICFCCKCCCFAARTGAKATKAVGKAGFAIGKAAVKAGTPKSSERTASPSQQVSRKNSAPSRDNSGLSRQSNNKSNGQLKQQNPGPLPLQSNYRPPQPQQFVQLETVEVIPMQPVNMNPRSNHSPQPYGSPSNQSQQHVQFSQSPQPISPMAPHQPTRQNTQYEQYSVFKSPDQTQKMAEQYYQQGRTVDQQGYSNSHTFYDNTPQESHQLPYQEFANLPLDVHENFDPKKVVQPERNPLSLHKPVMNERIGPIVSMRSRPPNSPGFFGFWDKFGRFHQGYTDASMTVYGGTFDEQGKFHFGDIGEYEPVEVTWDMMAIDDDDMVTARSGTSKGAKSVQSSLDQLQSPTDKVMESTQYQPSQLRDEITPRKHGLDISRNNSQREGNFSENRTGMASMEHPF